VPEPHLLDALRAREDRLVVVAEVAGVVEQHPDRDAPVRQQARQVPLHRVVEPDPAEVHLLQHGGGDEGLGGAADAVVHVRPHGQPALQVGEARRAPPVLPPGPHRGVGARDAAGRDLVERALQLPPVEPGRRRRGRRGEAHVREEHAEARRDDRRHPAGGPATGRAGPPPRRKNAHEVLLGSVATR